MKYLNTVVAICLLRAGPQHLPASTTLLAGAIALYLLLAVTAAAGQVDVTAAALSALVDVLLLVAFVHTGLLLRDRAGRFVQTLTAAIGAGVLMGLILWGAVVVFAELGLPLWPALIILLWNIVVLGEILKQALDLPLAATLVIATLYFYLSIGAQGLMVPEPERVGS